MRCIAWSAALAVLAAALRSRRYRWIRLRELVPRSLIAVTASCYPPTAMRYNPGRGRRLLQDYERSGERYLSVTAMHRRRQIGRFTPWQPLGSPGS
jgi:hypothetical protein